MGGALGGVVFAGVMTEGSGIGFSSVWRGTVNCTRSDCSVIANDPSMNVQNCYVQRPNCVCKNAGGPGFKTIKCEHFYGIPSDL